MATQDEFCCENDGASVVTKLFDGDKQRVGKAGDDVSDGGVAGQPR
jgi:hypothetical protein